MQDSRRFEDLPLGGRKQPTRIHRDEMESVSLLVTTNDSGTIKEFLGAWLVNGTGCTSVKAISSFYLNPRTTGGGGGNFAY
jgi:hypothetical protein